MEQSLFLRCVDHLRAVQRTAQRSVPRHTAPAASAWPVPGAPVAVQSGNHDGLTGRTERGRLPGPTSNPIVDTGQEVELEDGSEGQ
eukprot:228809-Rhodomonas_salina.1